MLIRFVLMTSLHNHTHTHTHAGNSERKSNDDDKHWACIHSISLLFNSIIRSNISTTTTTTRLMKVLVWISRFNEWNKLNLKRFFFAFEKFIWIKVQWKCVFFFVYYILIFWYFFDIDDVYACGFMMCGIF